MSNKEKLIITYSAIAAGIIGGAYAVYKQPANISAEEKKNALILSVSIGLLGFATGIAFFGDCE